MKKLLTMALALVALAVFADLGVAEQKGREKSPPTGVKASPKLMKVEVLEVNEKAKTVTIMVKGKAVTLNAATMKAPPKVGESIYISSEAGIAVGDPGCLEIYDKKGKVIDCVNARER